MRHPLPHARAAVNALVYGRKHWYVVPPAFSFSSKLHPTVWLENEPTPAYPVLQCTQEEGDLIYVPDMWGHAIVNAEDSIGYAIEFHQGPKAAISSQNGGF